MFVYPLVPPKILLCSLASRVFAIFLVVLMFIWARQFDTFKDLPSLTCVTPLNLSIAQLAPSLSPSLLPSLSPFVAAALIIFLFAITEFTTFFNQQSNSRKRRVAWEHLILIICGGNSNSGFYFLVADIVAIYHSLDGSTETGKINVGTWKNR